MLEDLSARRRRWDERPDEALLDVLSWPARARAIWMLLNQEVRALRGVTAVSRTSWKFDGVEEYFSIDARRQQSLRGVTLVRAYPLILADESPREGISNNALAAVVIAAGLDARPTPMLIPMLDDRSVETCMLLHGQPQNQLFELHARLRPQSQQPAAITLGESVEILIADVCEVAGRMLVRLEREVDDIVQHKYGMAGRSRDKHRSR